MLPCPSCAQERAGALRAGTDPSLSGHCSLDSSLFPQMGFTLKKGCAATVSLKGPQLGKRYVEQSEHRRAHTWGPQSPFLPQAACGLGSLSL